uniref:Pentacotripeptide-repeat region of PRORP domain-containing protein n=1 Tax=Leersia perrieri TaxID=77586 RepID=A0A0D9XZG2_9ORYZ
MAQRDPISWNSLMLGYLWNINLAACSEDELWLMLGQCSVGRSGCISQAQFLFTKTYTKYVVPYNVMMIIALACHGHARDALELFNVMVDVGLQPDTGTFLGVLSAFADAGLVDYGKHYFESIRQPVQFSNPQITYACVVDLYGRAELIEEAQCSMPAGVKGYYFLPDVVIHSDRKAQPSRGHKLPSFCLLTALMMRMCRYGSLHTNLPDLDAI